MSATYTDATVQRCATIIARADRDQLARILAGAQPKAAKTTPAPKAQPVRKPQRKQDWRDRPASDAQVSRIQRAEFKLGYKPSTRRTIGTAGQASALYTSLKAELVAEGL